MKSFASAFIYVSYFSVLIPIAFLLFKKLYTKKTYLLIVGVFLGVSAISDLTCYVLSRFCISNIPIVNVYFVIQFFLLCLLYHELLQKSLKEFIIISAGLFTIISLFNTFFIQHVFEFQSITLSASSAILISFSILCLNSKSRKPTLFTTDRYSVFWINSAVLYYFASSILIFVVGKQVVESINADATSLWLTHDINNTLKNLMFASGFYWAHRKPEQWEMDLLN